MAHFYISEELLGAAVGDTVTIAGPEARHAVTVSRVTVGDPIVVGNGSGLVVGGTVTATEPQQLTLTATSVDEVAPASPAVFLAQALAKGDRDESAVQAATELGVDGVIPWAAQRSIVKWEGPKLRKGHDRWSAIVREASKQSLRPWLPDVAPLVSTKQLAALAEHSRMLVLDPAASNPLSAVMADGRDIVLVVGPEGGISSGEIDVLVGRGAEVVRLGDTVLRTSTAGPAALAVLNVALSRW
ncbi:16S rRNA (uracil(1498)-N(3))-methyltransferase [Marisediminicola senii]|uniref:16S rRNA (uracil(1498)-N(3))-methyltransferase n=1 Tax=Marisediminicola senii TaxID=2711233 RepID=UPI0013EE3ADB|nr:16S rRNA (uracil(1498)-N(3))-methyltransferase [Marisediminicola senii]